VAEVIEGSSPGAEGARASLGIGERFVLVPGVLVTVTGRVVDPDERGTCFGSSNLADHVGDDPVRVADRRALLATSVGVDARSLVFARAEHGVTIVPVLAPSDTGRPGDGVIATRDDVAVMAMAADCVPFAVVDPVSGAIAAVHAGWRGTAAGIVGRVIEAFADQSRGTPFDPTRLRVHLGPAVCGPCYPVGPEVVEALAEVTPGFAWHAANQHGHDTVDLRTALTAQWLAAGLASEHVSRSTRCTVEASDLFSHRRDGTRPTGRHALVVSRVAA
jgi:polyphenol oxidase